jgi:Mu transposase-like protein
MVLSHSRDPFCCFTASQDLGTFWDCHRRAFAHFGGVPAQIVYDRTKTVVRRHVGRGQATPLHPEALAFAGHYDFAIWLAAPYRAQTKGRVERQVEIVRSHVLAGRSFASLTELDAAFAAWLPTRRAQTHRTHGEVIAVRAQRDRAALGPLPDQPYVVCERHTRRVGKDALVSFAASHYSVPWRKVRPGGRVELRATPAEVAIWSLGRQQELLATHPRAPGRGGWVVDQAHWEGLADRADAPPLPPCAGDGQLAGPAAPGSGQLELPGLGGWASSPAARVLVAHRALVTYDHAGGLG